MSTPYADAIRRAALGDGPRHDAPDWLLREYATTLHGAYLALRATGHDKDADALDETIDQLRRTAA